ncbi:hypothetical protein BHM03_00050105 [Ensete ventricosum]|nr:hypothetical protein BHM03_00050105 [Ensete ventricosum]
MQTACYRAVLSKSESLCAGTKRHLVSPCGTRRCLVSPCETRRHLVSPHGTRCCLVFSQGDEASPRLPTGEARENEALPLLPTLENEASPRSLAAPFSREARRLYYESMLDLFICHLNPSAMRHLAQKLEEAAIDSELRRSCERILRVRSTGWTQGIFANFAAESMVPKGPEWGGGNWDIKTPINMKDIPQWELAGEVMPYMRTDDGGIPVIVADHIGVYLGAIRGRGTVVEANEKSLVKVLSAVSGESKSPFESQFKQKKASVVGNSKGDPMVDNLTKQLAGPNAPTDEQAKAEEEFKKTLYGVVDGGSSDEDETTAKTKKIHIRIRDKPVTAATVDVNKLKEATKQLGLGPPMRTKSLSGPPQDFSLISTQTTPDSNPNAPVTAADMFGADTLSAQTSTQSNPIVTGTGVVAGPIPEDFFQNTISSLQVAASLPPPGQYLSRVDQNPQVMDRSKLASSQNVMADIGLPDGGVPPQESQQSQVSQQSATPLAPVGLPEGGVPPQFQNLPPRSPNTVQPVDLSFLEGSNPGNNATNTSPLPPSQPTAVRPGQVSMFVD